MTREEAIVLARESAARHVGKHDYIPADVSAWTPHEWVIEAIVDAARPYEPTHLPVRLVPLSDFDRVAQKTRGWVFEHSDLIDDRRQETQAKFRDIFEDTALRPVQGRPPKEPRQPRMIDFMRDPERLAKLEAWIDQQIAKEQ